MADFQAHRPQVDKAHAVGQNILRDLEGKEHEKMNARLRGLTSKYTDLDDMLTHRLDELEAARTRAEDFEAREGGIGVWLGEKEKVLQEWEVLPVDSATLEQHIEKIGVSVCVRVSVFVHTCFNWLSDPIQQP